MIQPGEREVELGEVLRPGDILRTDGKGHAVLVRRTAEEILREAERFLMADRDGYRKSLYELETAVRDHLGLPGNVTIRDYLILNPDACKAFQMLAKSRGPALAPPVDSVSRLSTPTS